jgi:two-component system phosphate regulon sensor histidine kinase PhoR
MALRHLALPWRSIARWALLAAITAAGAFLAWWTWRTTGTLERLGARSVIESTVLLVREKIDRVEAMIINADNNVLHLVDPDDLSSLSTRWPFLAERVSPSVRSVLVVDHEGRVLRAVARGDDDRGRFARRFEERIRTELRLPDHAPGGHHHWHGRIEGEAVLVSYLTRERDGRRYHVVLETDLDYVRREVFATLFDDPAARARFNVTDEDNHVLYGRALSGAGEFLVSMRFPTTLYKWRLAVAPRQAPALEASARSRRWAEAGYAVLSLAVILVGVVFLAFAARQEERLNQLKSDFIATVSHELKTPLALIRMFGEMLASDRVPTPEKRRQYLDIIVRESERLTALIENVLDFARLEGGRASYEFSEGDLAAAVRRAVDAFRVRIVQERPALQTDIEAVAPLSRLDERAMHLLVFNLLDNAFKYAADGDTVVVRVRTHAGRVALEVEDHGPGIDADDARRIFERFYRGRSAQGTKARGSGIGLSLVKHIAQAHGGEVSVRAASPRGTIFAVTIPTRADP